MKDKKYIELAIFQLREAIENANKIIKELEESKIEDEKPMTADEYALKLSEDINLKDYFNDEWTPRITSHFADSYKDGGRDEALKYKPLIDAAVEAVPMLVNVSHYRIANKIKAIIDKLDKSNI